MTLKEDIEQWRSNILKPLEMMEELRYLADSLSECTVDELNPRVSSMLERCEEALTEVGFLSSRLEDIQRRWGNAKTVVQVALAINAVTNPGDFFQEKNVCNDPKKSSEYSDRPTNETTAGETPSTKLGKEIHAERAAQRRASGQYDLVNEAIPDKAGNPIFVPKEIDIKTGKPKPDTPLQKAVPDAVNFNQALIIDDKPLGRPIMKDRQEIIRFINAYKEREGVLPQTIEIHRYDQNGQMARIESYKPEDFLPKTTIGGTKNVYGT
jgi:hypothetical protein